MQRSREERVQMSSVVNFTINATEKTITAGLWIQRRELMALENAICEILK